MKALYLHCDTVFQCGIIAFVFWALDLLLYYGHLTDSILDRVSEKPFSVDPVRNLGVQQAREPRVVHAPALCHDHTNSA